MAVSSKSNSTKLITKFLLRLLNLGIELAKVLGGFHSLCLFQHGTAAKGAMRKIRNMLMSKLGEAQEH